MKDQLVILIIIKDIHSMVPAVFWLMHFFHIRMVLWVETSILTWMKTGVQVTIRTTMGIIRGTMFRFCQLQFMKLDIALVSKLELEVLQQVPFYYLNYLLQAYLTLLPLIQLCFLTIKASQMKLQEV